MNLVTRVAGALGFVRKEAPRELQALYDRGWTTVFSSGRDPYDFQRDIHVNPDAAASNWAYFACRTLIAGDIGKMRPRLQERSADGIWNELESAAFSPVLRKPNKYQTWQKFIESWMLSKLGFVGNAYVFKERDNRKVVVAMHVLNGDGVVPQVAPNGDVYYKLCANKLAGIPEGEDVYVPASEIIHDPMWCLEHALVGVSPLYACGLAAMQGLSIQKNSALFFSNMSRPSGVLTAPGFLTDAQADTYKKRWEEKYGAGKQGSTAILGNGLVYNAIGQSAADSQLVDQLKLSAEMICSTFHVPGWKVGVGARPAYQNASLEQQAYYNDAVQTQMQGIEALLTEGLGADAVPGKSYRVDLDEDALLRMDEGALTDVLVKQTGSAISKPDEARKRLNLPPEPGGNVLYLQQQNYSLPALAKRDAKPDPFASAGAAPAKPPAPADDETKAIAAQITRAGEQFAADLAEMRRQQRQLEEQATQAAARALDEAHEFAVELIKRFQQETA